MKAKIVAIPLLAAIWLGSPAAASTQDPEPEVLPAPVIRAPQPRDAAPRMAQPRDNETVLGKAPEPLPAVVDDEQRGGRGRGGGSGRGNGGGSGRGNAGGSGRGSSGPRVAVPRPPSAPIWSSSYRRPYYPYHPPSYYHGWAYRTYGWSPLYYMPWSWIYGTAGYANFGFSYGYNAYPLYGPGWYGMYPPYGGAPTFNMGSLRLEIRPRDAQVFVDGYYAGVVDEFDGTFQSLRLEQGGHKIEIRMPGFETLTVDIHVQPNRTMTIREELKPRP